MTRMTIIFFFLSLMSISPVFANNYQLSRWLIINDSVMGGVSTSEIGIDDGMFLFSGRLSLANNGGFASTRARIKLQADEQINRVKLCVVGDGRTYKIRFRTNVGFDGMAYSSDFATVNGKLTCVDIPERQFSATFRGYQVIDAPKFRFADIEQIGFMIADKKQGSFKLKVSSLLFE